MVDKADNQKIVVSVRDTSSSFSLRSLKPVLLIVIVVMMVIALLYAVPLSRPLVNRYLGIAKSQTAGPCSGNTKFLNDYSTIVAQQGVDKLGDIPKQARAHKDYEQDPSCVYVSMVGYYAAGDFVSAIKEFDQLDNLKAHGKKQSAQIQDGINLKQLKTTLKLNTQKPENPNAQG